MGTHRFPVLIWEDYEGFFTARLVDDEDDWHQLAGTGTKPDEAVFQLKEYLQWSFEHSFWRSEPDFQEPKLLNFSVEVRPEYRVDRRVYPCNETFRLHVACVHGKQESGLFVGVLPTFDIRFYYYDEKNLKSLVTAYVQENLKGFTPQQLSRFLPPKRFLLDEIVAQASRKEKSISIPPELGAVIRVAEPLGDRSVKRQYSRAYERDQEIAELTRRLTKEKANVILVGESGVGKTSILVDTVRQIERDLQKDAEDPDDDSSFKYKFWQTSGARLIAGMKYLGQWQERCEEIIEQLSNIEGVLCLDNLLDVVRLGGVGPNDSLAAFLLPYLKNGELRLVAEATPAELDAFRRLLPGFVDVCQILHVPVFSETKALQVLKHLATTHKNNLHCTASDDVIPLVYRLFKRFAPYQTFPGRVVVFFRELYERASLQHKQLVLPQDVIEHFIQQTGLPEIFLRNELLLNPEDVFQSFLHQVIGQTEACRVATQLVTTFKAGLNDPNRPLAVLLFCGPTGVGKTELAKTISKYFFGHGEKSERLVRLDMSEFSGPGSALRLVMEPDGTPSPFIKKVRQQPFTVVLLDEIEKADHTVFDVLLSVFDEGRLTDRYGRTTTFRSAVIVMTSNLGASASSTIGYGEILEASYEKEALKFFRPEFFNRMDSIVRFSPLTQEMILEITQKELSELQHREGLKKANLHLTWTNEVVEFLASQGFDKRYGARPLQRTIEMLVTAPLARFFIEKPALKNCAIHLALSPEKQVSLKFSAREPQT